MMMTNENLGSESVELKDFYFGSPSSICREFRGMVGSVFVFIRVSKKISLQEIVWGEAEELLPRRPGSAASRCGVGSATWQRTCHSVDPLLWCERADAVSLPDHR